MMHYRNWDTLRRTIFGEARGQEYNGLIAVAYVVVNRLQQNPKRWGVTVADVCTKPKQFSCWNAGDINRQKLLAASESNPEFVRCGGAAAEVLLAVREDPTNGANHYHTIARPAGAKQWPPAWAAKMTVTASIDDHVFLKE